MSTKSGWCLSADCDKDVRGGCPIKVGSNPACDCLCHAGQTGSRAYLQERLTISRSKAEKLDREAAEDAATAAG